MWLSLFSIIGSYASVVALIIAIWPSDQPITTLQMSLLIFFAAFALVAALFEFRRVIQNWPKSFAKKSQKITEYMFNWLSNGGRCAIFTRDMTWATESKMDALLRNKARNNELAIFMPEATDLALELCELGAEIYTYETLKVHPQSRFTIAHWEQDGSRVAVGRPVGDKHVIKEYSQGEHPFFAVAEDMLAVIRNLDE